VNKRVLTIFVVVGLALAALPLLKLPAFYESFLYLVFHWVVLATSWNILSGYSGYFSFGHGAFFGLGMYTTAVLAGKFNWPFLYTLPMAALVPALFGVGLGAVVFRLRRLRGELFGLLTLAVTFVIATIILNTPIDGGPGVYLSAVPIPAIGPSPSATFYLLALAMVMLVLWVAYYIYNARLGSGLFAIHDDEDVAEVQGVPTYRFKLQALAISCAFAGVAGGVHALFVSYVTAGEVFNIVVPLYVVLMSVLGGSRHWLGPAVGATAITALSYAFTAGDSAVVGRAAIGLILIVVILFMPDGILGQLIKRFKAWWDRTALANPPWSTSSVACTNPKPGAFFFKVKTWCLCPHTVRPIRASPAPTKSRGPLPACPCWKTPPWPACLGAPSCRVPMRPPRPCIGWSLSAWPIGLGPCRQS
jgi:branched-chain amino acid transport system permease protein